MEMACNWQKSTGYPHVSCIVDAFETHVESGSVKVTKDTLMNEATMTMTTFVWRSWIVLTWGFDEDHGTMDYKTVEILLFCSRPTGRT